MARTLIRLVPVFLLLMSCRQMQMRKELNGVWNYDLEATRREMLSREASPSEINYMESIMTTLTQAQLHFQKGGDLIFALDGMEQEGSWRLQASGGELVLNLTGADQISTIEYLSSDTLILAPKQVTNGSFPRVLVARPDQE